MKISIIGTGYVGLVTGACLAEKGHEVTCVDVDPGARGGARTRPSRRSSRPASTSCCRDTSAARLQATTDLASAVLDTDVTFIAVGTPFDGRTIDLTAVLARHASRSARRSSRSPRYHVVVVKSTVVPGTTDRLRAAGARSGSGKKAGADFGVGMNPEFLSEGEAVHDFMFPDRIVLGGIDERTHRRARRGLRSRFPDAPRMRTNTRTAEMIKYASNALLATLISFSQRAREPRRGARRHRHRRRDARRAPEPVLPRPQRRRAAADHGVPARRAADSAAVACRRTSMR